VKDAIVFVSDMGRSVAFYRTESVFGSRLAQYADPDALTVSVGEVRAAP
jgi:predicted enzyme related to lactoylglutathione lyase